MINELTEDSAPQKYPSDSCVKEILFFFPGGGGEDAWKRFCAGGFSAPCNWIPYK